MGFMDKMKDAAKQAGEAGRQMGEAAKDSMAPGAMGDAQAANRIGHQGTETKAILKSLEPVGGKKLGGGTEYKMELEVQPEGGTPYAATITQQLIEQSADHYKNNIGGEIVVKVDTGDPNKMVLWG